jgi:DNA-binding response OmpR family regulator
MLDWYRKARDYKEQLDEANETIRQLRAILRPPPGAHFPREWGLTPAEARLLHLLAVRGEASHDALLVAGEHRVGSGLDLNTLKVEIHRIRAKLAPVGVKIGTSWGNGYYLSDTSREIVKAALRAANDVEKQEINEAIASQHED